MDGELGKIMECLAVRSCTLFLGARACKARSFSPKDAVRLRMSKHPKYFFVIGSNKEWALFAHTGWFYHVQLPDSAVAIFAG